MRRLAGRLVQDGAGAADDRPHDRGAEEWPALRDRAARPREAEGEDAAAVKAGRNVKNGRGLRYLSRKMGRSIEWCRVFRKQNFKRFTISWRPILSKDNKRKRLHRSKQRVALYRSGYKPVYEAGTNNGVVEVHCDEKWFFRGAPYAIWSDEDDPLPRLLASHRVAKHKREKLMVLAVVTNWTGRVKVELKFCEKQVPAKRGSKNRPKGALEWKDRPVDLRSRC